VWQYEALLQDLMRTPSGQIIQSIRMFTSLTEAEHADHESMRGQQRFSFASYAERLRNELGLKRYACLSVCVCVCVCSKYDFIMRRVHCNHLDGTVWTEWPSASTILLPASIDLFPLVCQEHRYCGKCQH
jgi:hypothetical protein